MNEKSKSKYAGGSVMNGLRVHEGFGVEYVSKVLSGRPARKMSIDEVRKILNESLGSESLYECVRQERDER